MIKIGATLFYLGLAVAAAGFLVDKAENLPGLLRFAAPSYVRASEGLANLQVKGSLSPGETGFSELERIFRREAETKGVAAQVNFQKVVKFTRKTAMISFGEARAGEVVPVEIMLSSTKVDWDMAGLRERADELKSTSLVRLSFAIFLLGIAVTLAGRAVENRGTRPNKALHPSAAMEGPDDSIRR